MKKNSPMAHPALQVIPSISTIPFILQIDGFSGLKLPLDVGPRDKSVLVYNVTLMFLGQFFGRTYQSPDLEISSDGTSTKKTDYVFLHTYRGHQDGMVCCVETYFKVRKEKDYQDSYHQVGYAVFEPFKKIGGVKDIMTEQLIQGSPRELLLNNKLPRGKPAHGKMEFKFIENVESVKPLTMLIPPNTLVGKTDLIPGLSGNRMKIGKNKNIPTLDVDVYLNNPDVRMSEELEKRFIESSGVDRGVD